MKQRHSRETESLEGPAKKGNGTVAQRKKNLPIGVENFEEIRTNNFYYVDKTGLIADLLNSRSEVTLLRARAASGKR